MKKIWNIILQATITLFVAIVLIYAFFCVGLSHSIDVLEYFSNGIKALVVEQEILVYFAVQVGYFASVYYIFKRKIKFYDIFDYFKEVITATVFITYGISIIWKITNEFSVILVIISILSYMCMIITFILKLSLRIYKLDKTDLQFNIFKILYNYKIESLIAILVILSQLIILIYGFAYFRFNTLLPNDVVDIGLIQEKSVIKNFIDVYYFSSVTFFTVGYGDILPHGDKLRLLVVSEMIIGFIMNILYVPAVLAFIIDLFNTKRKESKSNRLFFEPCNMSNITYIPCFSFEEAKSSMHQDFQDAERVEVLEWTLIKELNIAPQTIFFLDIVDDSLSMLNIYSGDKLLVSKQANLTTNDLGMFILDSNPKIIIIGHTVEGYQKCNNVTKPVKWIKYYWDNHIFQTETALTIGKVIYIKRKA